jgi:DNA-binding NarL/FixJ family response regulator
MYGPTSVKGPFIFQPEKPRKSHDKLELEASHPFRLTGSMLGGRPHICAFFDSPDDEYRVLLPFIKEGLAIGEKAVHTMDPRRRDHHLQHLASAGVDVDLLRRNGQLELRDWYNTHLRTGRFVAADTLRLFQEIVRNSMLGGFPLVRFVTEMEWFLETEMNADELLEYEARANEVWMRPDGPVHPIICTYDLTRFSADVVADAMRTHPMILIGGVLQENPFFVPPEELLKHPREKRRSPLGWTNDLMGILTLPSMWSGREPTQVVVALLEVVIRILKLDFAYALLRPRSSEVMETIRFADSRVSQDNIHAVRQALNRWLTSDLPTQSCVIRGFGDDTNFAVVSLSAQEHIGEMVASSNCSGFPTERDRFLLGVAANYAAIALQDAILRAGRRALAKLEGTHTGTDSDIARRAELAELEKLHASLTSREREVLPFVVAGFLSKQTAAELGTSEITIRVHRGQIMRKMHAQSLAELIRMADKLGIPISSNPSFRRS